MDVDPNHDIELPPGINRYLIIIVFYMSKSENPYNYIDIYGLV